MRQAQTLSIPLRPGLWVTHDSGAYRLGGHVPGHFVRRKVRSRSFFVVRPRRAMTLPSSAASDFDAMRADAVVEVDSGLRRLFVDTKLGLTFREMPIEAAGECLRLRHRWESRVQSTRFLSKTEAGQFETLVPGSPVAQTVGREFRDALHSAVQQLVSLVDVACPSDARAHIERGFQILDGTGQKADVVRLLRYEPDLCRAPLVPAGSDNSPHNAMHRDGQTTFIDVCPVTCLPAFSRPLGLASSWTANRRDRLAFFSSEVRSHFAGVLPAAVDVRDDELLMSFSRLAVAVDGTLDLTVAGAEARFLWLKGAYRL